VDHQYPPVAARISATLAADRLSSEEGGFWPIFCATHSPVWGLLLALTDDLAVIDAVVRETHLALIQEWERIKSLEEPEYEVFGTAIRTLRRMEGNNRPEGASYRLNGRFYLPHRATAEWARGAEDVLPAIRSLPRRPAEVLALHLLLRIHMKDVAQILHISLDDARYALYKALTIISQAHNRRTEML